MSTISRAAQVSTPMGERSEGQVGADAMAQVLNKIRQVEVRLEVLASTTKEVRKQVTGLKGSNDATVDTRTSTPAQSSASSSNTSQLGNEYGARSLEKMIARIEKFTQEAIREDMDISAVRKRHAVDLPKLQKLTDNFSRRLQEYLKADNVDDSLYSRCLSVSDQADEWIDQLEVMYEKLEIHTVDSEKHTPATEVK